MDTTIRAHLENIFAADRKFQTQAFYDLRDATDHPVDWAYDAWNDLVAGLSHHDNHVRAISAQILANLAKSDPNGRMMKDFDALLAVTKDERFVTARHCLQTIWKIGAAGKPQQQRLMDGLSQRFAECVREKNCTLIRFDIVEGMKNLYDQVPDEAIRERALALIETESDPKYAKKYAGVWRRK